MRLCEEYMMRHKIVVPLVRHVRNGSVFFSDGDSAWRIKTFEYHSGENHPGMYTVSTLRPSHNGFRGRLFEGCGQEELQWDEYEPYLLDWASKQKVLPPSTDEEIMMVAWEILLRSCDKGLIRHIHFNPLAKSIDFEIPIAERCFNINACLKYFKSINDDIYKVWEGDISHYLKNYAGWLAQVVELCRGTK